MRTPWSSLALAFVTACSFQASCGGKKIDTDKVTGFVANNLEEQTGEKPVTTCPASIDVKQGAKFECTAKFGDASAKVVIVQKDDAGTVVVDAITGILVSKRLEAQVAEGVGKQLNLHVEANCGPRVRPAVVGAKFQCDVKDAKGSTAKVDIDVKTVEGAVDWRLVPN